MKPTDIKHVLDLTLKARREGRDFVPLFSGDPGIGKSALWKEWASEQGPSFKSLDLRLAYYERPDVLGMCKENEQTGRSRYYLPEFWPTEGEGILVLEEPNRAPADIMQVVFQLLTDRKIGPNYTLPEGWIIASCINPEDPQFDVQSMDAALKNRFQFFDVRYDHASFLKYAKVQKWHPRVLNFLSSGVWNYSAPASLGEGKTFTSPRSMERLDALEQTQPQRGTSWYKAAVESVLGKDYCKDYIKLNDADRPVTFEDFEKSERKALSELKRIAKGPYRGDLFSILISSLEDNAEKVTEELLVKVAKLLPSDQAASVIVTVISKKRTQGCKISGKKDYLKKLVNTHFPELKEALSTREAA